MNNIINKDYKKSYNNPYRHGVLIGNFSEDIFGQDLKKKHNSELLDRKHFVSEKMEKYAWPELKEKYIKEHGNDFTSKNNSNFDLNIDFSKKNLEDYMKLHANNDFELRDKNVFMPGQIKAEILTKKMNETLTGVVEPKDMNSETQRMLKDFHQRDTRAVLYTKKTGLVKNLFFGHGIDQTKFDSNEYATTYHLTMNNKEKTDKIYDSKFKVNEPFKHPAKSTFDKSDCGFRKFKHYDEFTKTFDKGTNNERKNNYS